MEYGDLSLQQAAERIVMDELVVMGGEGGVIAVDREGNIATPFNTAGMYRARVSSLQEPVVSIYKD